MLNRLSYCISIIEKMASAFSDSRLTNFLQTKSGLDGCMYQLYPQKKIKLTLPSDDDKPVYQPTVPFNNTRTSMRMLKGRIQKGGAQRQQAQKTTSNNNISEGSSKSSYYNNSLLKDQSSSLMIHLQYKKQISITCQATRKKTNLDSKRITTSQKTIRNKQINHASFFQKQKNSKSINKQSHIQEEQDQEIKDQTENQNDLVQCPQGCEKLFNRKTLQNMQNFVKKFYVQRKQFIQQAKRLNSKEKVKNIVMLQQDKLFYKAKQKSQIGKTKGQGQFGKIGDNWKVASQDFRAALKGIKKNEGQEGQEQERIVLCGYCEKLFNELFLQKHIENCVKRKEKIKKVQQKKKK